MSCPPGGELVSVGPWQELTATPYALYALNNWSLYGNAGATPGAHFLGTTDNQPFEIKVNGQRALRIEPAETPRTSSAATETWWPRACQEQP